MGKIFENVNEAFQTEQLFTRTFVYAYVETSTLFSADKDGNPQKATEDVVAINMSPTVLAETSSLCSLTNNKP